MKCDIINSGDIVESISGRDKGNFFLVVKTNEKVSFVANGRIRKIGRLKKKNNKHLKVIKAQALKDSAENINRKQPFGNERLYGQIKAQIK